MRRLWKVVIMAAATVAIGAPAAWSSGFHPPMALFVTRYWPEPPLDQFAAGHLGLIQPGWERDYLYVCYRYFAGPGFDPDEQKALLSLWNDKPQPEQGPDAQNIWVAARAKIGGAPSLTRIDVYAPGPVTYMSFLNCNDDAFRTAAGTLDTMVARFGSSSSEARQWLDAQDTVFQNCPGGKKNPHIPQPLQGGTPFEQAQRAYQIASANFYSENFDTAASMFTAIAADSNSPWRQIAPYLVARTTIRKATLAGQKNDNALLAQAETQLNAVASGAASPELKAAAERLLGFVGCRLHPHERWAAEVHALMRPHSASTLKQDLYDYGTCGEPAEGSPPLTSETTDGQVVYHGDFYADDLDDWLTGIRGPDTHSIDKWKRTGSLPWMLASLAQISGSNPNAAALIGAADAIEPNSPAYVTAQFHVARLLIEQGKTAQARAKLDAMLARRAALPRSAADQLAWQRLRIARNFDEFLRYAQRQAVEIIGDRPMNVTADQYLQEAASAPLFDIDSVEIIDRWLPLSVLKLAPRSEILPRTLRAQIAPSIWLRAVLLNDQPTARELAPIVGDLIPDLKPSLDAWNAAKTRDDRRFEVVLMALRNPGMRPYVAPGLGRGAIGNRDYLRDNWWPSLTRISLIPQQPGPSLSPAAKYPSFLSANERESADREWNQLSAIDGPEFLCRGALQHANISPKDERVPEALYRCISAVHLGPADNRCDDLAKQAFQLLHRRYGDSAWAQQNRFWYHGGGAPTTLAASFERYTRLHMMVGAP